MRILESIYTLGLRTWRRPEARRRILELGKCGDADVESLASALLATVNGTFSPQEKQWIAKIERRRAHLLRSRTEVTITDFGAGSGEGSSATETHDREQSITRPLAHFARASKSRKWASLLLAMTRNVRPSSCLELGACCGISAAYQTAALVMNGLGKLATLEGANELATVSQETLRQLGLDTRSEVLVGPFRETLGPALRRYEPIQLAFIDGHHDGDATLEYYRELLLHLDETAILVFDDIRWNDGMKNAWQAIQHAPDVKASVDLYQMGIAIHGKMEVNTPIRANVRW